MTERFARLLAVSIMFVGCGRTPVLTPTADEADPARASPLYRELTAAEERGGSGAINRINSELSLTRSNVEIMALWLREAYLARPRKNPRYGLMYSNTLQLLSDFQGRAGRADVAAGLMESATLAYFSSKLIALEDILRCDDSSRRLNYRINWSGEREAVFSSHYASLNEPKREEVLAVVLEFVRRRDASEPDYDACGGAKAIRKAMEAGRCREATAREREHGHHIGGDEATHILCETGAFSELVSDEVWEERRLDVQAEFREWLRAIGH